MATTTNFGWTTPDDTALVKDGASAIRSLGSSIDTSMAQLKGGTTGQILSKTSNSDMAFTWIANDQGDITAVTAGTGLTGGGTTGAVTVSLDTTSAFVVPTQTGQSGKYLTTNGTSASWGSIATGSMTLLSTTTLSGTETSITSISQSYRHLWIEIENFQPTTDGNGRFRLNANTGSVYTTATKASQSSSSSAETEGYLGLDIDNVSQDSFLTMFIPNYTSSKNKYVDVTGFFANLNGAGFIGWYPNYCYFRSTAAVTSIQLRQSSGWVTGTVRIYGVN